MLDRRGAASAMWATAAVGVLAAVARPVFNPDLYWHLSAGRRILQLGAIPTSDWLSSTRAGQPWYDFEWLAQLIFAGVHGAAGWLGLWALKGVLVCAIAAAALRTVRLHSKDAGVGAAALALVACALMPFADLRPDLFSALGLAMLFSRLESLRLDPSRDGKAWLVGAGFCVWANVHSGYLFGLALLGAYLCFGAGRLRRRLAPVAVAALAGACVQPTCVEALKVLWLHGRALSDLSRVIVEWAPPDIRNPWHWPYYGSLTLLAAAFGWAVATRRHPAVAPAIAALGLAIAGARHARLALFFAPVAVPAAAVCVGGAQSRARTAACWALAILASVHAAWLSDTAGALRRVHAPAMAPQAAAFLLREKGTLGGRPVFAHSFEWGGYLGWRLWPSYPVFGDGRYLFHDLQAESASVTMDAGAWSEFLDRHNLDIVLLERSAPAFETAATSKKHKTPVPVTLAYYALFMPRQRWALVHWDDDALVLVRRASVPAAWLEAREYKFLRPGDGLADLEIADGSERGRRAREIEERRHRSESDELAAEVD